MSLETGDIELSASAPQRTQSAWPRRQALFRLSRRLALSFCLVLLSSLLSSLAFADLSMNEILAKVSETYGSLQSYQLVADWSDYRTYGGDPIRAGEERSRLGEFSDSTTWDIDLAAVTAGKLRLQAKTERSEVLLVSDGVNTWAYRPRERQYVEVPTTTLAAADQFMARAIVEAGLLRRTQELLVNRYQGLTRFSSIFVLEKDNQIKVGKDKVNCYVLKMKTQDGEHKIWVDKNRFIVWRSVESSTTASEGSLYQKTVTVNLKSANLNARLEDSLFTFTPPKGAMKVQSLNIVMK